MGKNNWSEIWNNRTIDAKRSSSIFQTFCEMKKADGFDTHLNVNYYKNFYNEFLVMLDKIKGVKINSVYEVGCGCGVNLYLFRQLCNIEHIGGIDYSHILVDAAKYFLSLPYEIVCGEAITLDTAEKYDLVLSDSVFQYFDNENYGLSVLDKMYEKANKLLIIKEIHDKDKRQVHLDYRRKHDCNYDEHYKGLDKTYYNKKMFIDFAIKHGNNYDIVYPKNNDYWNNNFIFDFYLYK